MTPEEWARKLYLETGERHGMLTWPGVYPIADIIRAAQAEARQQALAEAAQVALDTYPLNKPNQMVLTTEQWAADVIAQNIHALAKGTYDA